jgi:hypothetical protein
LVAEDTVSRKNNPQTGDMKKHNGETGKSEPAKRNPSRSPEGRGAGLADGRGPDMVDVRPDPEPLREILRPEKLPARLTSDQRLKFEACEATIARGWHTFVEVGAALTEIRDQGLYREQHKDFEAYCRFRWGYARTHAYRLIDAAGVIKDLSPIGDKLPKPANEAQVRELVPVPNDKRAEVWKNAVAAAGEDPLTARVVRAVAAEFRPAPKSNRTRPSSGNKGPSWATLRPALRLIDEAERAAKEKDFARVRELLKRLRTRLAEPTRPAGRL